MTEYQLKLAKLYAKLLGLNHVEYKGLILVSHGFSCDKPFNPFIGQLQLDARDDFDVQKTDSMTTENCIIISIRGGIAIRIFDKSLIAEKTIECILKSKGAL